MRSATAERWNAMGRKPGHQPADLTRLKALAFDLRSRGRYEEAAAVMGEIHLIDTGFEPNPADRKEPPRRAAEPSYEMPDRFEDDLKAME